MVVKLIRVDKNGTKYYEDTVCHKCHGTGYIDYYLYHDSGICYDCGGTGFKITTFKEYTPEYEKKLQEKRDIKLFEKAKEFNTNFLSWNGFNEDGYTYVFIGNTYDIKDELKEKGAKFDVMLGWHASHEIDSYPYVLIHIDDYEGKDSYGKYNGAKITYQEIKKIKEEAEAKILKKEDSSNYVGNIGDKITIELNILNLFVNKYIINGYECVSFVYLFKDSDDNKFVWKASNNINKEIGSNVTLKGTIKDHSEYKGVKQTILTRCKVVNN